MSVWPDQAGKKRGPPEVESIQAQESLSETALLSAVYYSELLHPVSSNELNEKKNALLYGGL